MIAKVQAWKSTVIQPGAEVSVVCRISTKNYPTLRMIESCDHQLPVACSLNRSGIQGRVLVRCVNPGLQPLELKAGQIIGSYTAVKEDNVQDQAWLRNGEVPREKPLDSVGIAEYAAVSSGQDVPDHLLKLHKQAVAGCQTQDQEQELAELLMKYQDVFSRFDGDVGRTKMLEHSIPLVEGARPIRQPPHRLGPPVRYGEHVCHSMQETNNLPQTSMATLQINSTIELGLEKKRLLQDKLINTGK